MNSGSRALIRALCVGMSNPYLADSYDIIEATQHIGVVWLSFEDDLVVAVFALMVLHRMDVVDGTASVVAISAGLDVIALEVDALSVELAISIVYIVADIVGHDACSYGARNETVTKEDEVASDARQIQSLLLLEQLACE